MKINNTEKALLYQKFSIENLKQTKNNIETLILDNYNNKGLTSSLSLCVGKIKDVISFYENVDLKTTILIAKQVFLMFIKDPSLSKVEVTVILKNRKENPIPGKFNHIIDEKGTR